MFHYHLSERYGHIDSGSNMILEVATPQHASTIAESAKAAAARNLVNSDPLSRWKVKWNGIYIILFHRWIFNFCDPLCLGTTIGWNFLHFSPFIILLEHDF